jgi:hypothetical protein
MTQNFCELKAVFEHGRLVCVFSVDIVKLPGHETGGLPENEARKVGDGVTL